MLPVAAVRESVIETVLPGLAFVRLPSIRAIPEVATPPASGRHEPWPW